MVNSINKTNRSHSYEHDPAKYTQYREKEIQGVSGFNLLESHYWDSRDYGSGKRHLIAKIR
jgi:hypothetical protein